MIVVDALAVSCSGEGDGGVEWNPNFGEQPVEEIVQFLSQQEAPPSSQVAHLSNV